jgi:hypothetical protein
MTPITRRTLIKCGSATAAMTLAGGALMPPALHAATSDATPALFVFDARFARSTMLAEHYRNAGAALLDPREADLGVAWRDLIPSLLQQGQRIDGLTLWSDRMINEIFAREAGTSFSSLEVSAGDNAATSLQHWRLG